MGAETGAEHRRVARQAEELGIKVVGYQTDLYGPARVDDVDAAVALLRTLGPGDALLVKGSRRPARGRGAGVRVGGGCSVARGGSVTGAVGLGGPYDAYPATERAESYVRVEGELPGSRASTRRWHSRHSNRSRSASPSAAASCMAARESASL